MFRPPRSEGCPLRHVLQRSNTAGAAGVPLRPYCTAPVTSSRNSADAHVDSELVKLRLPGRRDRAETTDGTTTGTPGTESNGRVVVTSGKGRPTPKRSAAQGRR